MSKKDENQEENLTKSQAKRAARKKEIESAKKKAIAGKITGVIIAVAAVAFIGWIIGLMVVKGMNKVSPLEDHSAGLDSTGFISGIKASDKIELPDYRNIVVPLSEIDYTDEEVDAAIESYKNANKVLSTEEGLKVADGDVVNIDYVGSIDGVEFEGGKGEGYDLTIGSGAFIEGFEEQLIGAENLSTFNIEVTFPTDYASADLAGMDATFNVTINGIYVLPEFDDAYVAEHLSDKATTVEGYRQYIKDTNKASRLRSYVEKYLTDNTTVKDYDKKYLKTLKSIAKFDDNQNYEYTAMMYKQYLGQDYYSSFEDYIGMSESDYDVSLIMKAQNTYRDLLIYQAIAEQEGLTVDAAYYKGVLVNDGHDEGYYDTQVEMYGEPRVLQMALKEKVLDSVCEMAKVQ